MKISLIQTILWHIFKEGTEIYRFNVEIMRIPKVQTLTMLFVVSFASLFTGCTKEHVNPADAPQEDGAKSMGMTGSGFQTEISDVYTDLFDLSGGGWTGGDGAYSIPLPDGRILWTFGDSFLDTVYPDHSRPFTSFVNNTFVVQDGNEMTTLYGGTEENPTAYVMPDDPDHFYWTADGTVIGNKLYMFMIRLELNGQGGPFGFTTLGSDLAVFDLPDLQLLNIRPVHRSTKILSGVSIYEDEDYIYIYAVKDAGLAKDALAARIPMGDFQTTEYFDGTGFGSNPADFQAMTLQNGDPVPVSTMFSVFEYGGKYRLLTQRNFFGTQIEVYTGDTPVGPWRNRQTIYSTPETQGDIWTYNAFAHPHITDPEKGMLITYSVNSMDFLDLFEDARIYRPRFVWVKPE